jgi:hypothetical protein
VATTFVCPKGDQSDDPEFCSVCGIKIEAAPVSTSSSADHCPGCRAERVPGARFCETCRYDFKAQTAGPPPVVAVTAPTPTPTPDEEDAQVVAQPPPPTTTLFTAPAYWEAVVTVDPSLDVEPDPETPCPADTPERTFPLDLQENLVGRRSTARGVFPQVPLSDPGASHRHLMIYRNHDGTLTVSDLGSTNGSFLNGSEDRLEPGVKTGLSESDRVELGRWTRITFRHRP